MEADRKPLDRPLPALPYEFQDFEVKELLGEGGMCCVYRAQRKSDAVDVALKILKPSRLEDDSQTHHMEETGCGILESDYRIGRDFDHPNVLRTFSFHDDPAFPHLAIELFSPTSFHNFIGQGNQRYEELVPHFPHYVEQMSAALMHVHQCGWVHADVKPGNFLVDDDHHVKLVDFSCAKAIYVEGKFDRPLQVSGTDGYISPEQQKRWPLDARSDLYSLGRTLYVLLTGQFPFAERQKMTMKQLAETPVTPDAHRVNPRVTQEFADLLMDMMEEVPVNRPASITEVLNRFRQLEPFSSV